MTRSLGVKQAGTIRPRPTVHLLALTGILMARIRLSPPAGSVPNPLHPRAPPRKPRHGSLPLCTPRQGSPASSAAAPAEGTALGERTWGGRWGGCGQAAAGLFLEKCGI